MEILAGVAGFISGFCAGQMLLLYMLNHKSNQDLKTDRGLRIYGLLNWLIAALGAAAFMAIYRRYFG